MADNPVSDSELIKALDDLILEESIPDLAPGEITVKMVMERAECHHQQARARISRWVEAGRFEYVGKRREPTRGQKVDAWRLKEKVN